MYFFIIKIWFGILRHTFLILKKWTVSHVSIFHPSLHGKEYFDTRLKGWGPIWHSWKVMDQFDTKAKGWGLKRYLNLFFFFLVFMWIHYYTTLFYTIHNLTLDVLSLIRVFTFFDCNGDNNIFSIFLIFFWQNFPLRQE